MDLTVNHPLMFKGWFYESCRDRGIFNLKSSNKRKLEIEIFAVDNAVRRRPTEGPSQNAKYSKLPILTLGRRRRCIFDTWFKCIHFFCFFFVFVFFLGRSSNRNRQFNSKEKPNEVNNFVFIYLNPIFAIRRSSLFISSQYPFSDSNRRFSLLSQNGSDCAESDCHRPERVGRRGGGEVRHWAEADGQADAEVRHM